MFTSVAIVAILYAGLLPKQRSHGFSVAGLMAVALVAIYLGYGK